MRFLTAAFVCCVCAFAQAPLGGLVGIGAYTNTIVTGAPFSADEVTQNGDNNPSTLRVYRDSQGRVRRDRTISSANSDARAQLLIEVVDPVAHVRFTLETASRLIHRQQFDPPPPAANEPTAVHAGPGQVVESLGTQIMEGLACEGTRITTAGPSGSIIHESWRSPDLQLVILAKSSNPRTGERTQKLVNIRRGDPPAELFQLPNDYTPTDQVLTPTQSHVSSNPRVLTRVEPEYSDEGRAAGVSGSVMLSLTIGEDGIPRDISVVRSLGLGLDEKAIEALKQWRFQPGMRDGRPFAVASQVEMTFRVHNKKQ